MLNIRGWIHINTRYVNQIIAVNTSCCFLFLVLSVVHYSIEKYIIIRPYRIWAVNPKTLYLSKNTIYCNPFCIQYVSSTKCDCIILTRLSQWASLSAEQSTTVSRDAYVNNWQRSLEKSTVLGLRSMVDFHRVNVYSRPRLRNLMRNSASY